MFNLITIINEDNLESSITISTEESAFIAMASMIGKINYDIENKEYCFKDYNTGDPDAYIGAAQKCIEHIRNHEGFSYENPSEYIEQIRFDIFEEYYLLSFYYNGGDSYIKHYIIPCKSSLLTINGL